MMDSKAMEQVAMGYRVSLPFEIWIMIARLITSRKTLQNLSLVCREYRDIFAPFLHSSVTIELEHLSNLSPSESKERYMLPTLHYAKDFEVYVSTDHQSQRDQRDIYNHTSIGIFSKFVAMMMESMPHLESFRWIDYSFDEQFRPALMLRTRALRSALSQCSTLKNLSIQFSSQYLHPDLEYSHEAKNCIISLRNFKNLTSLELYGIHATTAHLVRDISDVLYSNPNLKKFGLGRASDVDALTNPESLTWTGPDFLELLCQRYEEKCKGSPLPLETLRLGHGTFIYKYGEATHVEFLKKLVDFSGLRIFHVFNGLASDGFEPEPMEIDWSFLNESSIRQLSITRLEPDCRKWLHRHGQSVEELIITDHFGMYDNTLDEFGRMRIPNLSMLVTHEFYVEPSENLYDREWSFEDQNWEFYDSDDSDSDSDSDSGHSRYMDDITFDSTRPVAYDKNIITVLDRLRDGGRRLTRLSLSLNFETQWKHFSRHLPRLNLLTHLRIDKHSHCSAVHPSSAASLWPGITSSGELARRYAKLMKSLCPSLKYIKIGHWACFEVTAPFDMTPDTDIYEEIKLRDLTYSEILEIPVFALEYFAGQSGLLGSDRYSKPVRGENEHEMATLYKIIGDAIRQDQDPRDAVQEAIEAGILNESVLP